MWTKQFIQRFLYTWVPLVLIVAAVLWLLYRNEVNTQLTITHTNEQQAVQLANQTITTELAMLRGDTLYLAELSSLYQWLDSGEASDRTRFTSDLLTFSRRRGLYEQVRFLDEHGREVVRINWNHGRPQVVPDDKLQDVATCVMHWPWTNMQSIFHRLT